MAQPQIQASFNSGEWAPSLWLRTDIEKYRSGAALLENFFVDYRGGASTRPGTRYCLRGYKDSTAIRLIPFQATFNIGYALEFGNQYIRFYQDGAPVLESGLTITGITNANPCVVTVTNSYTTGDVDWVYISGVVGMPQINGKYFKVHVASGTAITLYDLFGNAVDSTSWGTYTSGGATQRVYTIASPYAAADLALLKYAQNVAQLIICHPNYVPYVLTLVSPTDWTIAAISFGSTIAAPTGLSVSTTLSSGSTNYSYAVTAVDTNGQESELSSPVALASVQDLASTAGTNTITWTAVTGAVSYNVYEASSTQDNPVPVGVPYGFIGNVTGTTMTDSNIVPDFTQGPPVLQDPFASGSGVTGTTITNIGTYSGTTPTVTFSAPSPGVTAQGYPNFYVINSSINNAGSGYEVGDQITFPGGFIIVVTSIFKTGVQSYTVINSGNYTSVPALLYPLSNTGPGTGVVLNANWGVLSITISNPGSGYGSAPTVTFNIGVATATSTIGATSTNNPSCCAFFQQRLVFAATLSNPQTMYMSQPGLYFNFNTSNPAQDNDAITASIVSGQLNTIRSMINQPAGLIVLTDSSSWLVNGGSFGSAVTPSAIVASAQSFNGANDVPPVVVVYDMLYVQSKGSAVRDSLYNFYANVYTGNDISVISSHLFFGFSILQWAWAEEPFKVVWAVRNDGTLLALTFLKEQDFIAWSHHITQGTFNSVCSIIEAIPQGNVNAVYTVVGRVVNGVNVQYIERIADRYWATASQAWTVDCGIQYNGSATTSFQGGEFLAGATVTGLADGVPITPFTMPASGDFTLPTAASVVTVGLAFTPSLQTLYIDTGQPTIQSKQKKINAVSARVVNTLGLEIGTTFDNLVQMRDLVVGNIGSMTNEAVTDLVTGDVRQYMDPSWNEAGQFCFQQNLPYPATILGVMPQLAVGDTPK